MDFASILYKIFTTFRSQIIYATNKHIYFLFFKKFINDKKKDIE